MASVPRGAFDAAAHGAIQEFDAPGMQDAACRASGFGTDRGAIDDDAPLRNPFASALTTSNTSLSAETQVTTASTFDARASSVAGACTELRGQRFRFFGRAIPDGAQQPGAMEIARHAHAHGAETNKANAHVFFRTRTAGVARCATIER